MAERDLPTALLAQLIHSIELLHWRYICAHWDRKLGKTPAPPEPPRLPGDPELLDTRKGSAVTPADMRAWRERQRAREEAA